MTSEKVFAIFFAKFLAVARSPFPAKDPFTHEIPYPPPLDWRIWKLAHASSQLKAKHRAHLSGGSRLRQNLLNDFSMDVGEAKVSALEAVGELFVVEAKEMKEGRVEVVDVDFSIDYAEAKFVALAVDITAL